MGDISLVWHKALTTGLEKLRSDSMLCDTTIATSDGQSLATHACVLAAASPLLQTSLVKIAERCYLVNIAGITCPVWKLVLQFIYTGTLDADCISNVDDISSVAVTLQLPLLQQFIETIKKQNKPEVDMSESIKPRSYSEGQENHDFEIALGGSGDRPVVMKLVKNEASSEGKVYHLETGDEGRNKDGLEVDDCAAGSNDEDVSCDELQGDQSSELDANEEVETSSLGEIVTSSEQTLDVSVKPSEGRTESTGVMTRTLRHECDVCGRRFQYRSALSIHSRTHTDEKPYACLECGMKFGSRTVLKNHTQTHTTDREIFQCDQCDKCFLTKSGLWQHRRSHRGATAATTCTTCDKQLDSLDELREHLVVEHNRKLFACTKCHKMFQSEAALTTHTETHSGEKEFSCMECGQSFDQFNALKCHQRLHAGQKRFSCEECGAQFETKCGFKEHMMRHTDRQTFPCLCGKVYSSQKALRSHQVYNHPDDDIQHQVKKEQPEFKRVEVKKKPPARHRKIKPEDRAKNLCAECGQTFAKPSTLKLHSLIHAGIKPYVCDTCGHAFRVHAKLVMHQRRHTGEKPFACPACGRRFRLNEMMKRHFLIHTGEKPFVCSVCDKAFRTRSQVMMHHQYKHVPYHERRRHTCDRCGKSYLSSRELKDHGASFHGDSCLICSVCGKSYPTSKSLRSHMNVHTDMHVYQCFRCRAWFKWKPSLTRHLDAVHGIKAAPKEVLVSQARGDNSGVDCELELEQELEEDSLADSVIFTADV